MAKGKGQSKKRPAVEKKYDGGGSRVNAANTWDDMEHDSEDDCKFSIVHIVHHFILFTLLCTICLAETLSLDLVNTHSP